MINVTKTLPVLALGIALSSSAAFADVTIGMAGPVTGGLAAFGEQFKAGFTMAVNEINAAGGVNGQKIAAIIGDDQCDPKQAVAVANDLVSKKVAAVIGHFCSGSSIPASKVYAEEGTIMISPASTNVKLTDERAGPSIYRVIGRDDVQGKIAGAFIADHYKGKNVAVLDDKSAYAAGLAAETNKALNANGLKPVLVDSITPGEKDYTAMVSKLKSLKTDVVYYSGYHPESGLLVKQMAEQGMKAQFISGDALGDNEFAQIAGPASEGAIFTNPPDHCLNPANKDICEKFKAAGTPVATYTLYAYAAVKTWAAAATKAGSFDSKKVVAALNDISLDTAVGHIKFDGKGDVLEPKYAWHVFKGGKYAEDDSIK
jgi:branched-chain amino acid transport system substrate-binding protein